MALSTQVFLLCLCSFVADSYLFIYNGRDDPLHSFGLFPGLLQGPPRLPKLFKDQPFTTAYVTTQRNKILDPPTFVTSTEAFATPAESTTTEEINKEDNFLMNNVKVNGPTELWNENNRSQVNTLSINEDYKKEPVPILSAITDEDALNNAENIEMKIEPVNINLTTTTSESIEKKSNGSDADDPGLTKNTDFLIIPVNALSPSGNIPNIFQPLTNVDSPYNQGMYPVKQNTFYKNGHIMNQNYNGQVQYTNPMPLMNNYPNQMYNNNNNLNLYPLTNPDNIQGNGANNLYYVMNNPNQYNIGTPTTNPQLYHLVPLANLPNTGINPNNYIPYNYNNQPSNFIPYNNQGNNFLASNYVPITNQPNYYVPNTYAPINSNMPMNSQPNNFVPLNNGQNIYPSNYVPVNNNNFVPSNNYPNNYPTNNNPNDFGPFNNNNLVSNNNNQASGNFGPLDTVPFDKGQNNFVPKRTNEQTNVNMPTSSKINVAIPVHSVGTLLTFKGDEETEDKPDFDKNVEIDD